MSRVQKLIEDYSDDVSGIFELSDELSGMKRIHAEPIVDPNGSYPDLGVDVKGDENKIEKIKEAVSDFSSIVVLNKEPVENVQARVTVSQVSNFPPEIRGELRE
jgi:hypothetical protein